MNDWKPWSGGNLRKENYDTPVLIRFRNGREPPEPRQASWWPRWKWGDEESDFDIIAFRRVSE